MPKRKSKEKIDYYAAKIRKLEEKQKERQQKQRRRLRTNVIFSDSSDTENTSGKDTPVNEITTEVDVHEPSESRESPQTKDPSSLDDPAAVSTPVQAEEKTEDVVPELDADFLSALGDSIDDSPAYGEKIHPDLAKRWLPLLSKGIQEKDVKEKLLKEYVVPENCKWLRAPTLNPEISAAVTEGARARDKKIEAGQQQLGLGITAVNRAMSLLLTPAEDEKANKIRAIKILSEACRILSDLHHTETEARIKLLTPALDKSFLNLIQDVERDETLFGSKLSEKIKASKTIEKQGLQIKKTAAAPKAQTTSTSQPTTFRPRFQGNWSSSSRQHQTYSYNRGGRGAQKSLPPAPRKQTSAQTHSTKSSSYNKNPRAATRQ